MPHVHGISSDDDELDNEEWEYDEPEGGAPRSIPWIPILVAGGTVILVILIAVMLFGGGSKGRTTPTTTSGPKTEPLAATDPRVVAAQSALDAWGAFEGSGKVADLKGVMDPDGPQYKALAARAKTIKPGTAPFVVVLTNPRAVAGGTTGEQNVLADIVWKRDGKPDRTVTWNLVLRPKPDGSGLWLWTARKATDAGGSSGTAPVDFCTAAKTVASVPTDKDLQARLNGVSDDAGKISVLRDTVQQRADAWAQLAASAPAEIRGDADAVSAAAARFVQVLANASTAKAANDAIQSLAKDSVYQAGVKALPNVTAYVTKSCNVNVDPAR